MPIEDTPIAAVTLELSPVVGMNTTTDPPSSGHGSLHQSTGSLANTDTSKPFTAAPPPVITTSDNIIVDRLKVDGKPDDKNGGELLHQPNGSTTAAKTSESNGIVMFTHGSKADYTDDTDKECDKKAELEQDDDSENDEGIDFVNELPVIGSTANPSQCGPLVIVEQRTTPVAPDGGWGWVIVVVSFLCSGVVDGMCSVFGVLLPDLVIYFDQSSSTVAVAGSLLAGGFLLFGPVASVLINCFGCRLTTCIGGLLSAIALLSSPYATNVIAFILVFGGIGGLGLALIYLPASVMVGYYFERRRGLAAGIASSGAGFGMLVLSPLAAYLVSIYTWKGTLTVLAGVSMNCLVWGALMRPLSLPTQQQSNNNPTSRDMSILDLKKMEELGLRRPKADDELSSAAVSVHSRKSRDHGPPRRIRCYSEMKAEEAVSASATRSSIHASVSLIPAVPSDAKFNSNAELQASIHTLQTPQPDHLMSSPLQRKDIFYGGSIISLRSSVPPATYAAPLSDVAPERVCCGCDKQSFSTLFEMLDVTLFKNSAFLVICASSVFIQLGYFVPVVFITPYAQSIGISASQSAMLLSFIGVSNMIGRAGAGAVATVPCVNVLHMNNISLMITGLATALVTVLCASYTSLIVYAVVFGLAVAVFVPLTTIFLVNYIGLDKLTNAFGLLSMVKGFATMAGPPVAGALLDATHSYSSTFYFAGAMFAFAGVLFYLLPLTQKTPVRHALACPPV